MSACPSFAAVLLAALSVPAPLAGAVAATPAVGDVRDLAHPAVRSFSDREGLPQNTVHAIARDARGYLWVGTHDGAARWNGREWVVVDMPDRAVSNYVRALLARPDGSVWFGRESGGVVRLRPGPSRASPPPESFTAFDGSRGLPAPRVNHLAETSAGEVWAATPGGAARLTAERFEPVNEGLADRRLWVIEELEGDDGRPRLLAGGEGGLFALDGARWVPYAPALVLASVNSLVQTKDAASARTLWIGSYGGGVTRVEGHRVTRFGPAEGLASRLVTNVAVTRRVGGEQRVFVATRDAGLFALVGERFVSVPLRGSGSEVYSLLAGGEDDPGALWVGTRTAGLLRLEPASWLALDSTSGLPADQVLSLLETKDERDGRPVFWIGTANGIAVIRGSRLAVEGRAQGLPGPQVLSLAELRGRDRPPEIWASVVGLGLVRRAGGRWTRVDARPAFDADLGVWLLATTDDDGNAVLWVGTERGGLARMSRGAWTVLTRKDGLPSDHVVSLLETVVPGRRSLWVGTRGGGIAEIVGGRVAAKWDRASGLPNDDVLSLAEVRLPPGGHREVWAGTRAGVARRGVGRDARWSRLELPESPARSSETVLSIGQDRRGRIYLGAQRGVVRLTPREGASEGDDEFDSEVFGLADGLPSASANWGQLLDSSGRVWIATTAGVALLDPSREAAFAAPPAPLVVESAEALASRRAISPGAALSPRDHDVAFEYALLTPRRGGEVRYRTQLAGYEAAASPWVSDHTRTYTSLPPGRYVFRVSARDAAGLESGPVELPFTVASYPWLRPWAIALQIVALVGLLTLVLRSRERRFRRRAASLETLVAERTRQLSAANALLAELSVTDPLTGLANRRALETRAEDEWRRVARAGGGLAVVMLDVDHFKDYNDTLGHIAGDECLRRVGDTLRRLAQRPGDFVARYGGEEFSCLLSGLDREAACAHAERLRLAIEDLALPHPASPLGPVVTTSVGVAWDTPFVHENWRGVLAAADAALYRAKQNGRNRTEVAGPAS